MVYVISEMLAGAGGSDLGNSNEAIDWEMSASKDGVAQIARNSLALLNKRCKRGGRQGRSYFFPGATLIKLYLAQNVHLPEHREDNQQDHDHRDDNDEVQIAATERNFADGRASFDLLSPLLDTLLSTLDTFLALLLHSLHLLVLAVGTSSQVFHAPTHGTVISFDLLLIGIIAGRGRPGLRRLCSGHSRATDLRPVRLSPGSTFSAAGGGSR